MVQPLLLHIGMRPVLVALIAVATGCQTYAEHRAALVPHATPLTTDGQPLESTGELALGASNVHDFAKPGAGNPDAGDAVPSTQVRGVFDLRASRNLSIGVVYERGLAAGSHAVSPSEPNVDNGDVVGYGAHMIVSIPTGTPGLRVALAGEILMWNVPWVQYSTCIMNCGASPGFTFSDRGSDPVATFALGIIPSYRTGNLTVFGGMTMRNQPTIDEKAIDLGEDPEVQGGPLNFTLHAGAEVDVGAGVRLSLIAHQTVSRDPIDYAPSLAAMVTIPFGEGPTPIQSNVPWGSKPAI